MKLASLIKSSVLLEAILATLVYDSNLLSPGRFQQYFLDGT
jgi:hypothetical protein